MGERDYRTKGQLSDAGDRYSRILESDRFQPLEPHWRRISKNTITLFQVLIDHDLKDLVGVLERYPRYTQWVCEHFRYAYSYSERSADIGAASRLLYLGEPYFSKQFVRNLVRKLPKIENRSLEQIQDFIKLLQAHSSLWHPIVLNHYCEAITSHVTKLGLHPLQYIVLTKGLDGLKKEQTYDYSAEDRDAVLDIPYMT